MDPSRKRVLRLGIFGGVALLLATALIYTSFSASTEASKPSEVKAGQSYELTGKVVHGSIEKYGDDGLRFRIRDRDGSFSLPVTYTGTVPDPFPNAREVILSGELRKGTFVAEHDSLVTKCPSKFTKDSKNT